MSTRPSRHNGFEEESEFPSQADSGSLVKVQDSTSLPWLKLGRCANFEIAPDATNLLRKEHGHIGVVMVCGLVRSGKSYLMNALLDQQVFGVSDQASSFTLGVELCPELLPISQLGVQSNSVSPKLAFVDMEGQGDKGMQQDLKLATPLLIISKVVVLNEICPAGPAKEVILEKLKVMMYAAQCVANRRERRTLFGCLHVVLRDCPQDEEECQHIIFGDEDTLVAETDEQEQAMKTRNDIRTTIKLAFESIKVWCLPKIMSVAAPPHYRDADPAYVEKIDALRHEMASQLAVPKLVDGNPLSGSMIATLLPQVAEAMKSDQPALSPPSLMEHVLTAEAVMFADELMKLARSKLGCVKKRLPMDPDELSQEATAIHDRLAEKLEGPTEEKARAFFAEKFNNDSAELRVQNREQLTKLVMEVEQEINAKLSDLLQAFELPMEPEELNLKSKNEQRCLNEELVSRLHVVPATEVEAVMQRTAEMATRVDKDLYARNLDLFINKVERSVIADAQKQLELVKLPLQADNLNNCLRQIDQNMITKMAGCLHMVSASTLETVKDKALERLRLIEDSLRARNAVKLSQWAREAEADYETKAREQLESLQLPLQTASLRLSFAKVRSTSHEALEDRLRIVQPEEADTVRKRAVSKMQQLEADIVRRNSSSLWQRAKDTEEDLARKFKVAITALHLPLSAKRLQERLVGIKKLLVKDLDLSVFPCEQAQEIQRRIETKFQAMESGLWMDNSSKLWQHRWRSIFRMVTTAAVFLAIAILLEVFGLISLTDMSYALSMGSKNALASVWKNPAHSILPQGKPLQSDTAEAEHKRSAEAAPTQERLAPNANEAGIQEAAAFKRRPENDIAEAEYDDSTDDDAMDEAEIQAEVKRLRLAKEAREVWQATEEETSIRAKRLNAKELLKWLPYSTGVGILVTMSFRWFA